MPPARCSSFARPSRLALLAAAVVLTAACRVDTTVTIDVGADGGGRVTAEAELDEAAANEMGDLAEQVRVDDLRDAGWTVDIGDRRVSASKPFDTPVEAEATLRELGGPLVRTATLERTSAFAKTTTELRTTIDLTAGLESFSDAEVARQLGPLPLGANPEDIDLSVTIIGDLAGGDTVTVQAPVGQRTSLAASATEWHVAQIAAALTALLAAAGALLLFVRGRRTVPEVVIPDS